MTIWHLVKGLLTCPDDLRWFALLCGVTRILRLPWPQAIMLQEGQDGTATR